MCRYICSICMETKSPHNVTEVTICSNFHMFCSDCINRLVKLGHEQCPECTEVIKIDFNNGHHYYIGDYITNIRPLNYCRRNFKL